MLLAISGISGSGKSTLGKILASRLGWEYLDQDSFYRKEKPSITLSNGAQVKNWDCLEALDLDKMNESIQEILLRGNLVLTGFALRDDVLSVKPTYHIHLNTGSSPREIQERCIQARRKSKGVNEIDRLMVSEVVYPFYVETLKKSKFTREIAVYGENGERKSVEEVFSICKSDYV